MDREKAIVRYSGGPYGYTFQAAYSDENLNALGIFRREES